MLTMTYHGTPTMHRQGVLVKFLLHCHRSSGILRHKWRAASSERGCRWMNTAERVRKGREAAGLSVAGAARRAGIPAETWSRIENGHQEPRTPTVSKMAACLGLSVGELLRGESPSAPRESRGEQVLLAIFRSVPPEEQEQIVARVAAMAATAGQALTEGFAEAMIREEADLVPA